MHERRYLLAETSCEKIVGQLNEAIHFVLAEVKNNQLA